MFARSLVASALGALALFGLTGGGEAPPACIAPADVDRIVGDALRDSGVPGASVAIVCGDRIVYAQGYGLRDVAKRSPVDANTIFRFGSVTKQFVAAATVMLADDGKLSLDDRVSRWYPAANSAGEISVADLLNQVSGYRDYYPLDYVDLEMARPITEDGIIARYGAYPLTAPPRTRWEYSNTNYTLAGRIVERTSGALLQAFLRKRVFAPLGMTRTAFDEPPRADPDRATGYNSFFGEPPHKDAFEAPKWLNGAGALAGTANDLARWDAGLMRHTVLSADAFRKMTTERMLPGGMHTGYGFGFDVTKLSGHRIVSHGGAVIGFATANVMAPDDGMGVVIVMNTYEAPAGTIAFRLLRRMLAHDQPAALPSSPGPSPSFPAPSPAPPAASTPGADGPAGVIRAWIPRLQTGDYDVSQMTPDFRTLMNRTNAERARAVLAPLGPVRTVEFRGTFPRGGMLVSIARVVFASRAFQAILYQIPDGRVAELFLMPELPSAGGSAR